MTVRPATIAQLQPAATREGPGAGKRTMTEETPPSKPCIRGCDAELPHCLVSSPGADAESARQVHAMMVEARAAWPRVHLDDTRFTDYLARHIRPGVPLTAMNGTGLFLAAACLSGAPEAHDTLEQLVNRQVARCTRRLNLPATMTDELKQSVRIKLLVAPDGGEPAIASYVGMGPLEHWLGVVVTRTALNMIRSGAVVSVPLSAAAEQRIGNADPELQMLRDRYQEEFTLALQDAIASLDDRQRALLRLKVVHGLGVDRLAVLHQVGRTTAARWMRNIRQKIREEMDRILVQRLKVTPSELRSLARLMRSQIDASMERILEPSEPPRP